MDPGSVLYILYQSAWLRGLWWWATAIGWGVFLWGVAFGHVRDIIEHANYAPGNAGVILYWDILLPAFHLALLVALGVIERRRESREWAAAAVA